jgi:hypothetical protein
MLGFVDGAKSALADQAEVLKLRFVAACLQQFFLKLVQVDFDLRLPSLVVYDHFVVLLEASLRGSLPDLRVEIYLVLPGDNQAVGIFLVHFDFGCRRLSGRKKSFDALILLLYFYYVARVALTL